MTTVVITQPMLFPWPGFFEQLMLADAYAYLDDAQFSKGSFTNRVQLKAGDDTRWMTIPLAGGGTFRPIHDLEAAATPWREAHRALLAQSLRGAPFRNDALDILAAVHRHERLADLLIESIEAPARYLGIGARRTVVRTADLGVDGQSSDRVLALVRRLRGTRYLTGHGAARYLDHEAFEVAGVAVDYMAYGCPPWPQPGIFTPYVSILDLIARRGPESARHLQPARVPWRTFIAAKGAAE